MKKLHSIYIIDDDSDITELYVAALEPYFEIQTFLDGKSALNSGVSNGWPTTILVDLVMPDLNGIETIQDAKTAGFAGPFVICSGHADRQNALHAISLNAFAFIEKPFNNRELINTLKHAVLEFRLNQISNSLLNQNEDLAINAQKLINLYEQRLAEAELLMFRDKENNQSRDQFLDHQKYFDVFSKISADVQNCAHDIRNLKQQREDVLNWHQSQ